MKNEFMGIPLYLATTWVWRDKPFSKGQALIDLYMMSQNKDKQLVGNMMYVVEKGEIYTPMRALATRWGWSRNKVLAFLDVLESDGIINRMANKQQTKINIMKSLKEISEEMGANEPI